MMTIKKYQKVRDHCHYSGKYRGAAHDICNLRYRTPKDGPKYDYHFLVKELIEEFEGQCDCLGENTE